MTKGDFPALRMTIDGGRLVPAGPFDAERLNSYRRGTVVYVRFTEEKDRVLVRKWFAIIGLVLKQCKTPWNNKDEAHEAIKLALGIVNLSKTVGGQYMQYPKSLAELEDPELQEALEQMTELLSHMTGVDVATLRKETAHLVDEETVDPSTGEIIEHETTESGAPLPPDADEPPPPAASSAEGSETSPSDPSSLTERDILILYARDVLPMAADTSTPPASLAAIERQYAADEFKKLSEDGLNKARAISASMRAIANTPTLAKLGKVLEHYAEVLECTVEELGGTP
jgi:hypothetical protein